jgi:hypothetical protein
MTDPSACAGDDRRTTMSRGLDHIVHAVRDLEAAADLYRRLGFTVGARNRHAGVRTTTSSSCRASRERFHRRRA